MNYRTLYTAGLYVRESPIQGRGVYTKGELKAGDLIEESHFIILKDNKWENCDGELAKYAFSMPYLREDWKDFCDEHGGVLGCHVTRPIAVLGHGMIFNHSYENNVDYKIEGKMGVVIFKANRDIKAQEELTIDYGKEYWESREDLK